MELDYADAVFYALMALLFIVMMEFPAVEAMNKD